MLARRGSQILALTRRDAVRLILVSGLLVAGLTFILAFEDLSTMTLVNDLVVLAGWFIFSTVLVSLLMAWLWRFRSRLWHRNNAITLIALTLIVVTVSLVITGGGTVAPFVVPTAAVGLLLAVLLDAGVALVVTALLAALAGVITGSMELIAYTLMGGLAGIIVIRRGERLVQFGQAAAAIAIVNVAVVVAFTLVLRDNDLQAFLQLAAAALVSAIGAAVAAAGTFALLGSLFGITTSYQLLELANPTQPLLRRLLLEAPGTYHHSLMVGNLAEQAAEAIDADALVTRVAAYYHDIGKLDDPAAFIENQSGRENPHDELPPEASAAIVASHVARGIDIAYQYKLPKALIGYIPQHHGTALMGYFYAKAREQAVEEAGATPGSVAASEAVDQVDQRRFRHAGPKPQSREAAILMLADSVEASVRSLSSQDEPAIRSMVSRIISERLTDGQFDECDLTLRDLDRIRESFIDQLLAMYHRRIAYPTNKIVELESRRAAGRRGA
ncbi:MAG TPA: HDIG domain-containing protein [Candidatus Limnocylindrales bacterium]|nr:HDIG domain-containing protein [Candidatus Limnocylindrales bacterium]